MATEQPRFPMIRELSLLVRNLKLVVLKDHGSTYADPDDTVPSMDLTIGWAPDTGAWDYQTSNNGFIGGAHGRIIQAVTAIDRHSDNRAVARDLQDQLAEQYYQ